MRGFAKKKAVLSALNKSNVIFDTFKCGILALSDEIFVACAPDAVVDFDTASFPVSAENHIKEQKAVDGKLLSIATVVV